jgi:hypothetical protein
MITVCAFSQCETSVKKQTPKKKIDTVHHLTIEDVHIFQKDLANFIRLLPQEDSIVERYMIFPFYGACRYVDCIDNLSHSQEIGFEKDSCLRYFEQFINRRDFGQFNALAPHIDSLPNAFARKADQLDNGFGSFFYSEIISGTKFLPELSYSPEGIGESEDIELSTLLSNTTTDAAIIVVAFQYMQFYNGRMKGGSKHFAFAKQDGHYKLVAIRAFGHA